jgi:micrococcal nuclease
MYSYDCKVLEIVSGDTLDLSIDLGFYFTKAERVRLARVQAADPNTEEGIKAKAYIEKKVNEARELKVVTYKDRAGKHARYIAEIIIDGQSLNKDLLNVRLVKPYKKGFRKPNGIRPVSQNPKAE